MTRAAHRLSWPLQAAPAVAGLLGAAGLAAVALDRPTLGSAVVTLGAALALGAGMIAYRPLRRPDDRTRFWDRAPRAPAFRGRSPRRRLTHELLIWATLLGTLAFFLPSRGTTPVEVTLTMVQLIAVSHSFVLLGVSVGAAFDGDVRVAPDRRSPPA